MTTSHPYNDQIPTDPTLWAVLLLCVAAVIGRLTSDQVDAVTAVFGFATTITPLLAGERR